MSSALLARYGPWQTAPALDGGWVSLRIERPVAGARWVVVAHAQPEPPSQAVPAHAAVVYEGTDLERATALWRSRQRPELGPPTAPPELLAAFERDPRLADVSRDALVAWIGEPHRRDGWRLRDEAGRRLIAIGAYRQGPGWFTSATWDDELHAVVEGTATGARYDVVHRRKTWCGSVWSGLTWLSTRPDGTRAGRGADGRVGNDRATRESVVAALQRADRVAAARGAVADVAGRIDDRTDPRMHWTTRAEYEAACVRLGVRPLGDDETHLWLDRIYLGFHDGEWSVEKANTAVIQALATRRYMAIRRESAPAPGPLRARSHWSAEGVVSDRACAGCGVVGDVAHHTNVCARCHREAG